MKMEEGYMFIEYPDILTIEDTLEILDIGRNTLYALLRTGYLKAFKLGVKWKIPKYAVEEHVRSKCS